VLNLSEAPRHPHNNARKNHVRVDDVLQPAPAPRFSRTEAAIQCPPAEHQPAEPVLSRWGLTAEEIANLL
jgi:alpha-methylacyl-CoA racemase